MTQVTAMDTLVYLEDTTLYQIVTNHDTLKDSDGSVTVVVRITSGENIELLDLEKVHAKGYTLTADIDGISINDLIQYTSDSQISGFSVQGRKQLSIYLFSNDVQIAEKHLTVVSDGKHGDISLICYPAGEFDKDTLYAATSTTTPMVCYNGQYYMLNYGKSFIGDGSCDGYTNPSDEYAANRGTGYWQFMEYYKALFIELAMVNYGKIASAVFSGDFMFSQYGTYNEFENWWIATGTYKNLTTVNWESVEKITDRETREFRFALGGSSAPYLDTTARYPTGWSRIPPTLIDESQTMMWVTYADVTDGNVGEWQAPFAASGQAPYEEGGKVYCFRQYRQRPTLSSETRLPEGWSYFPTATEYANSDKYNNFDGETDIFDPNVSIDFKTGAVRLNNAVVKGTITSPKTYITQGNYQQYTYNPISEVNEDFLSLLFDNLTDCVVFEEGVPSIQIPMPSMYSNGEYTAIQIENFRNFIGKTIKFYNYSDSDMQITGKTRLVGSKSATSFVLRAGYCVSLTCVLDVEDEDDDSENIYWEYYSIAKIRTTTE